MLNPVAPYRYLLPNLYLSVADIANPDLFVCGSRTWISLDIGRFYEGHCQSSSGFALLGARGFLIIVTIIGSTVFRCLVYGVSFICLSGVSLVVMG